MTSRQELMLSVEVCRKINSLWYTLCWWKAKQHLQLVVWGPQMCASPGVSPTHPAVNPALQSSPHAYDYPANRSWLWLRTVGQPSRSNELTSSNYYLFRNLKSYLRVICCVWQCTGCLCCELLPFNGLWRHKLQRRHITDLYTNSTHLQLTRVFVENVHFTFI